MISKDVLVINKTGIHARPASIFVGTAGKFKSKITVKKGEKVANAKSIFNILALGVVAGSKITISAEGDDASEAVDSLVRLVESRFGEE